MMQLIGPHARLIAALAESLDDNQWAEDIETKCRLIRDALNDIERICKSRRGGER